MHILIRYAKKDAILFLSAIAAFLSCFLTPISLQYIYYPDYATLLLLFALMAVVEGLRRAGTFEVTAYLFLRHIHTERQLTVLLVLLCFTGSMLITNDVALITFVPFAIMLLKASGLSHRITYTVALMTISANVGSMFTPIGNPQNVYLYARSGLSVFDFMALVAPYTLIALCLCLLSIRLRTGSTEIKAVSLTLPHLHTRSALGYGLLFLPCLAGVLHWIPMYTLLFLVIFPLLLFRPSLFKQLDYSLLLTFIFFFILTGNLKAFPPLHTAITSLLNGHERLTAILLSQCISNVPAALLLSGYTEHIEDLIIGCNLGGLGTLIASMASVISYNYIAHDAPRQRMHYLLIFSGYNLLFLTVLSLL